MELNQNTEKLDNYRKRAAELVGKMTLEEKVAQTLYQAPAVERLNIKAYNWWNEALHGVARAGTATVFPQAIGLAATFDEDLLEQVGDAVSTEARAKFNMQQEGKDTDIYKGLTFWAPNVNIFRDPRWGRGHETFGEDPYLTSRLGVRYIEGLQGHDENYLKAAACAKHFAVHSGPEAVRHEFDAEVTEQDLRETYLPAFEACVKEGKVEAVMGAYNRTNGVPCCGNKRLLIDILRKEWGFSGHVTSDCWAIRDFHEGHHVTGTAIESVAMAMNNGCDLNCGTLFGFLVQAVRQGLVKEERLDEAVTNLFMARMKLGVFDKKEENPYDKIPYLAADSREMKKLNEAVARRTVVLLKNKEHILPLDKNKIKINKYTNYEIIDEGINIYFNPYKSSKEDLAYEFKIPFTIFKNKIKMIQTSSIIANIDTQTITKNNKYINSIINIPIIMIDNKEISKNINDEITNSIMKFFNDSQKQAKEYNDALPEVENKFVANVDFDVKKNSDNILSILIKYYKYAGGAHGYYENVAYNIDIRNGNFLTIDNLFKEGSDYKNIINEEIKEKERVINNSESFLTLVPKSTKYTGEIRILFKKNIKFKKQGYEFVQKAVIIAIN